MFVGGAGWGCIPCFSLFLSPSSCTLQPCVRLCMRAWPVPLAPSFAFLTYLCAIPLFPRGSWPSSIARACACLCVGRGGVHTMFLFVLVSVFLYLAALCTFVYVCVVRPFGALLRILNILVCHTIVSPWFVAIPHSKSVCVFVGGEGWGFIPCFSLTLSPSSFILQLCVRLGMCAWCDPLAPSFVFLTYLFAIPLFPHGPWPPHTFCASFFCHVPRGAWSLWRWDGMKNGDIWVWFMFVRMRYEVRGSSSFVFACGVVPLAPSFTTYLVSSSTHV